MPAAKSPQAPLIVADVGGTNARFAVVKGPGGAVEDIRRYQDADFTSFADALSAYRAAFAEAAPQFIAIGAAGPLKGSIIRLTNTPWTIDGTAMRRRHGLTLRALANDLVATAAGVAFAAPSQLRAVFGPQDAPARRTLVIAAGTGIGIAWFERAEDRIAVHSTEAGHMGIAPASEAEAEMLRRLIAAGRRHSVESIASGSGLPYFHAALKGAPEGSALPSTDRIIAAAESGADETARAALDFALGALATLARDLALALSGVDAIVFGGGLGRRLAEHLKSERFLARLTAPGDSPLDLSRLTVKLIDDDTLSLSGIAHLAFGRATCTDLYRDA